MATRRRWRASTAIRLAIALSAAHLAFLFVFGRYPRSLSILDDTFVPSAGVLFVLLVLDWLSRRRLTETGLKLDGPRLALAGCLLAFLVLLREHGGGVSSDGAVLFAYLRSGVVDLDLDLRNELEEFLPEKFQPIARAAREQGKLPDAGFELGPALFWFPLYAATHGLVTFAAPYGGTFAADGYGYPYVRAVCLASLLWAFVGVALSYAIARRGYEGNLAAAGAIVFWVASPLLWYTLYEPTMPHAVALAAVALFLTAWLYARDRGGWRAWGMVGLAAGLMLSVQRYNAFYLVLPALTVAGRLRDLRRGGSGLDVRAALAPALAMLSGLAIGAAPLWMFHLATEGSLFRASEPELALSLWKRGSVIEALFSSKQGLFSWTPAAYLAVIGLAARALRRDALALHFSVALALGVILLSTKWDEGFSFGSRRFTEAYPIFLFGFCGFLDWARRSPRALTALGCLLLAGWNLSLAAQVRRGDVPMSSNVAFSDAVRRSVEQLYEITGHPGAVPANWIFAWTYGVSPDRFDTVFGGRSYHDLTIEVGAEADISHLGRGWSIRERSREGTPFRWSQGESSSWFVTLFRPFHYRLRVEGEPARSPDGGPQALDVEVNGAPAGRLALAPGLSAAEILVNERFWRRGFNEVVFRHRYTVEAGEAYGGSDPRAIAVRIERIELRIERVHPPTSSR